MATTSINTSISTPTSRSIHRAMQEVNTELARVHKTIKKYINPDQYIHATNFVEQYISYTSLWNLKFSYNMQSPEVAFLQLLHLDYIFKHESPTAFTKEREVYNTMNQIFHEHSPYSNELIEKRKQKMLDYISNQL